MVKNGLIILEQLPELKAYKEYHSKDPKGIPRHVLYLKECEGLLIGSSPRLQSLRSA